MVTIYRHQSGGRLTYKIWDDGKVVEVSERIALSHQRAGRCKIRTLEQGRSPKEGNRGQPDARHTSARG